MSPARRRTPLGNANSLAERVRVYRTERGLEIDLFDYSEIVRWRIAFAEIELVTLHGRSGGVAAWIAAGLAGLFAILAALLYKEPGLLYTLAGLAFVAGLIAGIGFVLPTWTVTVFGKRSLARLIFRLREARAREVYGEICRLTAEAQEQAAALAREAAPPLPPAFLPPAFLPPPPLAQPIPEAVEPEPGPGEAG